MPLMRRLLGSPPAPEAGNKVQTIEELGTRGEGVRCFDQHASKLGKLGVSAAAEINSNCTDDCKERRAGRQKQPVVRDWTGSTALQRSCYCASAGIQLRPATTITFVYPRTFLRCRSFYVPAAFGLSMDCATGPPSSGSADVRGT